MNVLHVVALATVAVGGTVTVLVRDPVRQALVAGVFGFALAFLFFSFQAPDVALSQIVVATVAVPLMVLLALAKLRRDADEEEDEE
ncbi:MAG TPA: hydrogenase subunit MbhD domain-containing protein [Conexibacter sp.]|nr:hydrogenase subunit MbhD domain-containing protein [Conexibacter sp.]